MVDQKVVDDRYNAVVRFMASRFDVGTSSCVKCGKWNGTLHAFDPKKFGKHTYHINKINSDNDKYDYICRHHLEDSLEQISICYHCEK